VLDDRLNRRSRLILGELRILGYRRDQIRFIHGYPFSSFSIDSLTPLKAGIPCQPARAVPCNAE
jgi:hypothetical protein